VTRRQPPGGSKRRTSMLSRFQVGALPAHRPSAHCVHTRRRTAHCTLRANRRSMRSRWQPVALYDGAGQGATRI
jgi:hypothetical protein